MITKEQIVVGAKFTRGSMHSNYGLVTAVEEDVHLSWYCKERGSLTSRNTWSLVAMCTELEPYLRDGEAPAPSKQHRPDKYLSAGALCGDCGLGPNMKGPCVPNEERVSGLRTFNEMAKGCLTYAANEKYRAAHRASRRPPPRDPLADIVRSPLICDRMRRA